MCSYLFARGVPAPSCSLTRCPQAQQGWCQWEEDPPPHLTRSLSTASSTRFAMQRFPSSKHRKQRVLHHKCVCTASAIQTTPGSRDKSLVKAPNVQNLCQLGMEQPGLPALWPSLLTLLSGNKQPRTWPQNISLRIHQCFWRKQGAATHHCARRCLSILAFPDLLSFFVILQFPLCPCGHTHG